MKEMIYEWICNMTMYQLLISIIMNLIPEESYQKYIRFFLGMLFMVIAIRPVLQIVQKAEFLDLAYMEEMLVRELEEQRIEFEFEKE